MHFGKKRLSTQEVDKLIEDYRQVFQYVGPQGPNQVQDDYLTGIIIELSNVPGALDKLRKAIRDED